MKKILSILCVLTPFMVFSQIQPATTKLVAGSGIGLVKAGNTYTVSASAVTQTITLTGDVTGSGTGTFATTFKTSPTFTGTVTATNVSTSSLTVSSSGAATYTLASSDSTTQIPYTKWVKQRISAIPSLFTDAGAYTYLTSTSDNFRVGTSAALTGTIGVNVTGGDAFAYTMYDDGGTSTASRRLSIGQASYVPYIQTNGSQFNVRTNEGTMNLNLNSSVKRISGLYSGVEFFSFSSNSEPTYVLPATGYGFQVGYAYNLSSKFAVKGEGSTSGTINQLNNNSSGTNLFTLKDDGYFSLGNSASAYDNQSPAIGYFAKSGQYGISLGVNAGKNQTGAATRNIIIGINNTGTISGSSNIIIGEDNYTSATSANNNIVIGNQTCDLGVATGTSNAFVGKNIAQSITSGSYNTAMGIYSQRQVTSGQYNTSIGYGAGYATTTTSNGVNIGAHAGENETAGNKLFIDAIDRTNESNGRTESLVYGVFNATVASQQITFNAGKVNINAIPHDSTGLSTGDIYIGALGVLKFKY